ncbi:solute carrier family 35 protein [Perilla frutescens var. hirtella]|uniref:Solute carrier family 35 protein n=1 Tax=Perilla frutescens var. hirtella TaxID=608512 RepID=A0AAD4IVH6_PERFH|nr:solute carrier family 35 protein [Perilla frutescens var. hirtella]
MNNFEVEVEAGKELEKGLLGIETKYRFKKLVGVVIYVAALVMVVFSYVHSANRSSGSNPIKGDLLVIAGATLYGVSNVSEVGM